MVGWLAQHGGGPGPPHPPTPHAQRRQKRLPPSPLFTARTAPRHCGGFFFRAVDCSVFPPALFRQQHPDDDCKLFSGREGCSGGLRPEPGRSALPEASLTFTSSSAMPSPACGTEVEAHYPGTASSTTPRAAWLAPSQSPPASCGWCYGGGGCCCCWRLHWVGERTRWRGARRIIRLVLPGACRKQKCRAAGKTQVGWVSRRSGERTGTARLQGPWVGVGSHGATPCCTMGWSREGRGTPGDMRCIVGPAVLQCACSGQRGWGGGPGRGRVCTQLNAALNKEGGALSLDKDGGLVTNAPLTRQRKGCRPTVFLWRGGRAATRPAGGCSCGLW